MTPGDGVPDDASLSRAKRSKHVRRANHVKSNGSSQKSQVKQGKSSKDKLMLIQHMLDVNMLVWSSNSSQESQGTEEKPYSFNTCCMSTCLAAKTV